MRWPIFRSLVNNKIFEGNGIYAANVDYDPRLSPEGHQSKRTESSYIRS